MSSAREVVAGVWRPVCTNNSGAFPCGPTCGCCRIIDHVLAALGIPPDASAEDVRARMAGQAPEGWRLAPVEATPGMERAATERGQHMEAMGVSSMYAAIWRAMLAAAPEAPHDR